MTAARLHPDDLAALADLVVEGLAEKVLSRPEGTPPGLAPSGARDEPETPRSAVPRLLTAADVAARFGLSAEWVRDHADDVGAIRLGTGKRRRLRFDPETVAETLTRRATLGGSEAQETLATPELPRRRRSREVAGAPGLLPFDTFESPASEKSGPGAAATARDRATRRKPSPRSEPTCSGSGSGVDDRTPLAQTRGSRDA